jgi:FKBP-type peptidyl-prolyl cis-trans isomerase FkpA
LVAAIGCTRQSPQLPANKQSNIDSLSLAVQSANQRLIAGEDSILSAYIQKRKLKLTQSSSGMWYSINSKNKGNKPQELESCKLWYSISLLSDSLLLEKTETIIIGKKQIINGIEEAVLLMHQGDEALLIIPWYLAYGMKGSEDVAPYTSIKVMLKRI